MAVFCFLRCSFYSSPDDNTCPLVFRGNYIHVKATINYEDAKSILNLAICASPSLLLFLPSCSTQVGLLATKLQISKSHLPPSSFGIKMSMRFVSCSLGPQGATKLSFQGSSFFPCLQLACCSLSKCLPSPKGCILRKECSEDCCSVTKSCLTL